MKVLLALFVIGLATATVVAAFRAGEAAGWAMSLGLR